MPYKTGSWGKQAKDRYKKRQLSGELKKRSLDYYHKNKKGEYSIGYIGELEAKNILHTKKIDKKFGYDFVWKNKKIDVKTSIIKKHPKWNTNYWKFLLYHQKGKVDYFLIICKDVGKKTKYIFLIPDKDLPNNNLVINIHKVNKYFRYLFNPTHNI